MLGSSFVLLVQGPHNVVSRTQDPLSADLIRKDEWWKELENWNWTWGLYRESWFVLGTACVRHNNALHTERGNEKVEKK